MTALFANPKRKRTKDELDGFQWYCDSCNTLLYEKFFPLNDIVKDLPVVFDSFWEDIVSNSDWENLNKIKKAKTAVCYSVGWLMAETTKTTVIMSDLSFEDNHEIEQGGSYTTIPTKNVLSIKKIKL